MTAFTVEKAAVFAVERAAASVAWSVASATGCIVHVAWAGVDTFSLVDTASGPALAAGSVLAWQRWPLFQI